jgi:hypothetical protein
MKTRIIKSIANGRRQSVSVATSYAQEVWAGAAPSNNQGGKETKMSRGTMS